MYRLIILHLISIMYLAAVETKKYIIVMIVPFIPKQSFLLAFRKFSCPLMILMSDINARMKVI